MAIVLPLNPQATSAADDAFYAKYPHMVGSNGGRLPLDPGNPEHNSMRADWCNMYEAALVGDAAETAAPADETSDYDDVPAPEQPPEDPCQDCVEPEEEEFEIEHSVKIRISVFFDGTGNNRFNERRDDDTSAGHGLIADGESNVSKMEEATGETQPEYDHYRPIYIEGIATLDGWNNDPIESGTGMGVAGVSAKVKKGIRELLRAVDSFGVGGRPVTKFTIDAFGFSRGAAAARYFIWRMLHEAGQTLDDRLAAKLNMQCSVDAKFLGLYDTVSSHGLDHEDDVDELKLDRIYQTDTIVQLAAAEEHRKNFRLTTIRSGEEIYLPGVHSDVGGGYHNNTDEEDWQLVDIDVAWLGQAEKDMFEREEKWILERGWATKNYTDEKKSELKEVNFFNELKWTRRNLTNYYSRIPLQIMRKRAEAAGIPLLRSKIDDGRCTIQTVSNTDHKSVLERAEAEIDAAIGSAKCASASGWMNNKSDWHRKLRNKHLHQSARYGEFAYAHTPNWSTGDPVTGTRVRGVNAG